MKRVSKVCILILLITAISFIRINRVEGATFGDGTYNIGYANTTFSGNDSIYIGKTNQVTYGEFTVGGNPAFCLNPGRNTGSNVKLTCKKLTSDSSESSYEAGVVAIINEGYGTYNGTDASHNHFNYVATGIALRIYEAFWPNINTNPTNYLQFGPDNYHKNRYEYHANLVNYYYSLPQIRDLLYRIIAKYGTGTGVRQYNYPTVNGKAQYNYPYSEAQVYNLGCEKKGAYKGCTHVFTDKDKNYITFYYNGKDVSSDMRVKITQLLMAGLQAAADNNSSIRINSYKTASSSQVTEKDGEKTYTRSVTYTATIRDASREARAAFECSNCAANGVSYKIYLNDELVGIQMPKDLRSYADANSNIKIKIEFTSNTAYKYCRPIKYTLYANSETTANSVYKCHGSDNSVQQFDVVIPNTDDNGKNVINYNQHVTDTVRLCEPDCEDLKKSCEDPNNSNSNTKKEDCEQFDKEYNSTCVKCTTNVKNDQCTEKDSDINIKEGYEEKDDNVCNEPSENDLNVLGCVVKNKDAAGNSYEATNILKDNKYCSVWCKEDYHFTLPGNKVVNSGRYFTLEASISGTKTCYVSKIDKELFKKDIVKADDDMAEASINWHKNVSKRSQYAKTLNAATNKMYNIVDEYNECTKWAIEYNFNPEVQFDYEESFMNNVYQNTLDTIGTITEKNKSVLYCNSTSEDDINDGSYNKCSTGWSTTPKTETISLSTWTCNNDGSSCNWERVEKQIYSTTRMKSTTTKEGKYVTPTQFYQFAGSGELATFEPGTGVNSESQEMLENALPVGLNTKHGVYAYSLVVNNLGEYYNSDKLGRIWGAKNSVVSKALEAQSVCYKDTSKPALRPDYQVGDNKHENGVYVCKYTVNCPDCPVECEPPCEIPDPDECTGDDCPVECENCIFDGTTNLTYRPISTDNMNPTDRKPGVNWQYSDNIKDIKTALEMKAYATTNEIIEVGEDIYDETATDDGFVMKVTLDSKMINKIKEYNKTHDNFSSSSLKCYDHKNSNDGQVYKNVYCYSEFIDKLLEYDSSKVEVNEKRVNSENLRKKQTQDSGYWKTWSEATNDKNNKWATTTQIGININKDYKTLGIGPAWK